MRIDEDPLIHPRYQYCTAHLLTPTPSRPGAALCCLRRLGRGPAVRGPVPRSRRCALVGGPRPARLGPAQGGAYGYRGRYAAGRGRFPAPPFFAGGRPCGAARPLAARAAIAYAPPPAPPPRPLRGFGVVGPSAGGAAVPSTVDALPLCPLLPGWPPGGRSAPGSRAPGRRGSPRRSRRRRSGPGGPRGAAAATGRLGRRCRPARAPGPLFLCSCCGFRARRGARGPKIQKTVQNGRKTAKTGENSCKTCMSQV